MPAITVNRVCISGMEAVLSGAAMIQAGVADVILAGGVEHLSGAPYAVLDARWGCRLQDTGFIDTMIHALYAGFRLWCPAPRAARSRTTRWAKPKRAKPYFMGITAEWIVQNAGIDPAGGRRGGAAQP